jgi:ribokinase
MRILINSHSSSDKKRWDMPSFDVVTMGSATQDAFAKTQADTVTFQHNGENEKLLAYPLGTKILIEELHFEVGGGGTNTACVFARQGLKTGFLGKLGADESGEAVLTFLEKENITFLGARGGQTGYSVILDSQEDDRTILTFKGANNDLGEEDINGTLGTLSTQWLYCSSMMGKSYETMRTVMRHVHEHGDRVAFNPSSYQAKLGLGTLQRVLDFVDVLILNKEEAGMLTGHQTSDLHLLLRVLAAAGPHLIIITDGKKGSTLFDGACFLHVSPPQDLEIVETTGAGDAFGAGFVAGLARGFETKKALLLGALSAEHVISHYGAKHHLLTREEAERMLAADRRTIKEEKV